MEGIGKALLFVGIAVALLGLLMGLLIMLGAKLPFIGRLPGDIVFRRGDATFYFSIVTSLLVSIVLTVLLNIAFRLFR